MKITAAIGAVGSAARGANAALAGGQFGVAVSAIAGPLHGLRCHSWQPYWRC